MTGASNSVAEIPSIREYPEARELGPSLLETSHGTRRRASHQKKHVVETIEFRKAQCFVSYPLHMGYVAILKLAVPTSSHPAGLARPSRTLDANCSLQLSTNQPCSAFVFLSPRRLTLCGTNCAREITRKKLMCHARYPETPKRPLSFGCSIFYLQTWKTIQCRPSISKGRW